MHMPFFDRELPGIAITNLREAKIRSYLTLSGIIIGIIIIVSLTSIGESLQKSIEQQFESMGMNTLFLEPGSEENQFTSALSHIRESDISLVRSIQGVDEVIPFYETGGTIKSNGDYAGIFIFGIDPAYIDILKKIGYLDIEEGRELSKGDKYSIIIYNTFAKNAFKDDALKVREKLVIDNNPMRVIGISKPNSFLGMSISNIVLMTKDAAKELFGTKDPTEAAITVTDKSKVAEVKKKIEEVLEKAHGEKDFYVMSSDDILKSAGMVLGLVQIVLIGIASISILVGGVGITNTMLMAVMERTREIGVMKAIGATNARILSIFLAESAFIGGIGGTIGIIIGLSLSYFASIIAESAGFNLPFTINPLLVMGVFIFSLLVGIIAGYVPAKRAAGLDPVKALHYE